MNHPKMICALILIIFPLFVAGCGNEEDIISPPEDGNQEPIETEKEVPEIDMPTPFNDAVDAIKLGMEEENVGLYLDAFWEDGYSYHSDLGTDDMADDVTFDNIELEGESIQRLFSTYDSFSVEFSGIEIVEEAETAKIKAHHQLLASVGQGKALPGGYQKIFAEGDNVFSFKKIGNKWRISKWEQAEMSKQEIIKAFADLGLKPPEKALIQTWGELKAR